MIGIAIPYIFPRSSFPVIGSTGASSLILNLKQPNENSWREGALLRLEYQAVSLIKDYILPDLNLAFVFSR